MSMGKSTKVHLYKENFKTLKKIIEKIILIVFIILIIIINNSIGRINKKNLYY